MTVIRFESSFVDLYSGEALAADLIGCQTGDFASKAYSILAMTCAGRRCRGI